MNTAQLVDTLTTPQLVAFLEEANSSYRAGQPIIDDETYDHVYLAELKKRVPDHAFLSNIEPEGDFGETKVKHETPMLSTEKAYDKKDISAFIKRVESAATKIGIPPSQLEYRITPKLDGMAGRYSNNKLVTRGNGDVGNDVTYIFDRGVLPIGGVNTGAGEIVLLQSAWEPISHAFSHPRNVVVGLVGADTVNTDVAKTLSEGAVRFVPYSELTAKHVSASVLLEDLDSLCTDLEKNCGFPTDGSVIEVTDETVKAELGHTSHHHRWQIARKQVGETAVSTVTGVQWQTGRTGRVTPIVNIEKTKLSGAWISNVTGHHAGNIKSRNIGIGCRLTITRSGEVIPFLCGVESAGEAAELPDCCPSCNAKLSWENDFLVCTNSLCTAQIANRLIHFFNTIGNIDLFGEKTVQTLLNHGVSELPKIYELTEGNFVAMGFGPKQSQNLVRELKRSRTVPIEDWRFLASFGIRHLGRGDSRKLLSHYSLSELPSISATDIESLDSFGPLKSPRIATEIKATWPLIEKMISLGFKLHDSRGISATTKPSPISGLNIVFTGKMNTPRKTLQDEAIQLGATPQSSVSSKTHILVAGENVGSKKISSAQAHGTKILTEDEYLALVSTESLNEIEPSEEPAPEAEVQHDLFG